MGEGTRLDAALAAIDAVNATDPETVEVDGVARPKELVHAEHMTRWVQTLDPEATDAQLLAARAHHLRRWVLPRSEYADGRAGYLRWRAAQRTRQAHEVGQLLASVGYDPDTADRVAALVAKQGLGRDPQVQVHEDALCLTFLELQLDELADRLGDDHVVQVLRRTATKMSPAGIEAASALPLSDRGRRLLLAAVAPG